DRCRGCDAWALLPRGAGLGPGGPRCFERNARGAGTGGPTTAGARRGGNEARPAQSAMRRGRNVPTAPVLPSPCGRRRFVLKIGGRHYDGPGGLAGRGGGWCRACDGDAVVAEIHVGVDEPFRPARRAHPALVVDSLAELEAMAERIEGGGFELSWAERATFTGYLRFHARD